MQYLMEFNYRGWEEVIKDKEGLITLHILKGCWKKGRQGLLFAAERRKPRRTCLQLEHRDVQVIDKHALIFMCLPRGQLSIVRAFSVGSKHNPGEIRTVFHSQQGAADLCSDGLFSLRKFCARAVGKGECQSHDPL